MICKAGRPPLYYFLSLFIYLFIFLVNQTATSSTEFILRASCCAVGNQSSQVCDAYVRLETANLKHNSLSLEAAFTPTFLFISPKVFFFLFFLRVKEFFFFFYELNRRRMFQLYKLKNNRVALKELERKKKTKIAVECCTNRDFPADHAAPLIARFGFTLSVFTRWALCSPSSLWLGWMCFFSPTRVAGWGLATLQFVIFTHDQRKHLFALKEKKRSSLQPEKTIKLGHTAHICRRSSEAVWTCVFKSTPGSVLRVWVCVCSSLPASCKCVCVRVWRFPIFLRRR